MKQKIVSANTKVKKVYIGLGSNLKNREENLKTALKEIKRIAKITKKSSIYETNPIGYKDQGKFLNMAIEIETLLFPIDLIISLQEIEHKMGRTRTIRPLQKSKMQGYRKILTAVYGQVLEDQNFPTTKQMGLLQRPYIKNGPRIIDLDILLYGNEIIDEKNLKIPHIRMHERKFVLEPLNEIAPKVIHPKLNLSINTLWTKIKFQN